MRGNKWFDKREREREKKSITGTNLIGKGERGRLLVDPGGDRERLPSHVFNCDSLGSDPSRLPNKVTC